VMGVELNPWSMARTSTCQLTESIHTYRLIKVFLANHTTYIHGHINRKYMG